MRGAEAAERERGEAEQRAAAAKAAEEAEAKAEAEAAEVGEVAEVAEMVDAQLLEFRRLRQREVVERQRLSDEEDARLEALWQANEEACDRIDQELEAQARLDTTLHYTSLHDSTRLFTHAKHG